MGTGYEVTITNFGGNDCSDDQFKFALKSVYTITSSNQIEGNRYMITSVPTAISVAMVDSIYDNHYLSCSTFTIEDKTFYDVRTLSQCSGGENLWTSYIDTLDHPEWGELEFEVEVNSDSFVFDSEEKTRVSDDGCTGITFALNLVIIIVVVVVVIIIIVIIVVCAKRPAKKQLPKGSAKAAPAEAPAAEAPAAEAPAQAEPLDVAVPVAVQPMEVEVPAPAPVPVPAPRRRCRSMPPPYPQSR